MNSVRFKELKPLTIIILVYGLLCYIAVVARAYQIIRFPYTIDYGESTILYQVKILVEGRYPYSKAAADVANYFSYTPIFQSLIGVISTDPIVWLKEARLINTASILLVGALISKIYVDSHRGTAKFTDWALPFLLWFSWYPVFNWTAMGRLDGLALLFQMSGLYYYLQNSSKAKFQAMICFLLAIFTKQTALWVPCALFAIDLKNKRMDRSWLSLVVGVVVGFLCLDYFSEHTLWAHLFGSNNNRYEWVFLWDAIKANGVFHLGILVIALVGVWKLKSEGFDLLIIFLGLFALPYVFGMGREGSGSNFLLELCVVLTFLTLRGIAILNKSVLVSFVAGIIVILTCWQNFKYRTYFLNDPGAPVFVTAWSDEVKDATETVIEKIKNTDGPIWAENPSLLIFAGKDVTFFPFEFKQAIARGKLDEFLLVREVEWKNISLIVLDRNPYIPPVSRISEGVLQAIGANYKPIYQNDYFLLTSPQEL
ncbi:hypothetical protein [Bdellovibrio sp. KM01]|uniref:hypothetical protein n=1 Tax=Bdellovibrio sp. KM01 TaxID=2748865 RepID=UPI0015E910A7|nr:hypothetical protein [Bdellovibrio sp. KM01]QLY25302.1 hypothetical protein HW988_18095 [Bdellovibrio sp. KM01]